VCSRNLEYPSQSLDDSDSEAGGYHTLDGICQIPWFEFYITTFPGPCEYTHIPMELI